MQAANGPTTLETRTPLALAILHLLFERPMHPYEMQQLMRERAHDRVIHLHGSSLYSTIQRLERAGLITAQGSERVGKRPPRTIYALTAAGRAEQHTWLRDLLATPRSEFPWFGAALAFLGAVPPDEARGFMEQRADLLEAQIIAMERQAADEDTDEEPALLSIEDDYRRAMLHAELRWLRATAARIDAGRLTWPAYVLDLHAATGSPHDTADAASPPLHHRRT